VKKIATSLCTGRILLELESEFLDEIVWMLLARNGDVEDSVLFEGLKHLTRFSQSRNHSEDVQSVSLISQGKYQVGVRGMRQSFRSPGKECMLKLELETRAIDDVTVLYCRGRFTYRDEATAFSEKIAELLPNVRQVVVELSGLEVIDSAGLGELVVVHMWIRASGCSLKLAGANPRIRQLLELTNLLSVFDVHPTLDDALLSFQRKIAKTRTAIHAA
jgi:anti-sigma B factor antagonist